MYNFVKLSDAPVVEDGATHVLGTKEGQVFRIPASGLGAVVLGLDQPEVVPTSVNAVAPRDISPGSTDGAVLTLRKVSTAPSVEPGDISRGATAFTLVGTTSG